MKRIFFSVACKGAVLLCLLSITSLCSAQSAPSERDSEGPKETMSALTKSVLQKWSRAYQKVNTLEYTETMIMPSSDKSRKPTQVTLRFWGKRPNLARVEVSVADANEDAVMICDGRIIWEYDKSRNIYMKTPYPDTSLMIQGELGSLVYVLGPSLMFVPNPYMSLVHGADSLTAKTVQKEGNTEALVTRVQGGKIILTWLNTKDYIPRRYKVYEVKGEGMTEIMRDSRTNMRVNGSLSDDLFHFVRPRGARLAVPERPELSLLKKGTLLPELSMIDEQDRPVMLSSLMGKTTLVVFWAQWLPLSREMLTDLTRLKEQISTNGGELQVIGVCTWDVEEALRRYRKENPESSALLFRDANYERNRSATTTYRQFGVRGLPTIYLVNSEGRVLRGWVGAGSPTLHEVTKTVKALFPE